MGHRRLRVESLEDRRLLAVVINEFHYDPDLNTEQVEFIELHNTGASAVDLSGWRIDEAVDFSFAPGSSIAAGGYLVVTQNAADFQAKFGIAPFGEWEVGDKLSNEGETIELLDAADEVVDTLTYELGFPWPTSGEYGSSVELVNPNLDNSLAGNWRSSGLTGEAVDPTLIATSSVWRYRKGITANPPTVTGNPAQNWRLTGFNEGNDAVAWQNGTTSIGYGQSNTTVLSDMQNNYTTVYLRKEFTISGSVPDTLNMRLNVDDGAIIWINGVEVARRYVTGGNKNYNDVSGQFHNPAWDEFTLNNTSSYLVAGTNTIAVHVLNGTIGSSDLNFNLELSRPGSTPGPPTPGAQNSVFATNSAPQMRELTQSVQQPVPGQAVVISMRVTDPDGVQGVTLDYQLVEPGSYIRITDAAYQTSWTTVVMHDDGLGGDATAGDGVYSVTLPGSLQTHRRLVRYRVSATDTLGATVRGPYADDPQPNFAYFVYGETPTWNGAVQPGVTAPVAYDESVLNSVATYHLITTRLDHVDAQHIPDSNQNGYGGSDYLWQGTLVYDGEVYDHIRFRARGGVWRYAMGKNMWKFDFNRGHGFLARDNYGNQYEIPWDKLNLSAIIQQRDFWHRGEQGLFESIGFKLFDLAGVPASNTNYAQFRIIESANESSANQYGTDFQGLYLAIEQLDGNFLDEHDLPDGNLYKMEAGTGVGGIGGELNNQGDYPEVSDSSDLIAFKTAYETATQTAAWWDQNLDLDQYYNYRAIVESIHHYDIGAGKNYFFFHNPESGKWETIPWDLDLTWANNMYGNGNEPFRDRVLAISQYMLAYRNRMREVRDLLFNTEQVGLMVDETAAFVYTPGEPSLVDADRAMWDYNPILVSNYVNGNKAGHGQYYAGGPGVPAPGSFAGMMQLVKDYATTRGAWIDANILTAGEEAIIPSKPTISYVGGAIYPVDQLQFSTSAFSDPNGSAFGKMEWRLAEISNPNTPGFDPNAPWKYEVDAVWESGELTTYGSEITIPGGAVEEGRTYRVRVRMQDDTGRWSHWSDAVEFVAAAAVALPAVRIVEFNYHPAGNPNVADEEDLEFLEIQNVGNQAVDMSGMQIADFATTPFVFPNGTTLAPGERLVVARNPGVLEQVYGEITNLLPSGYGTANLSNGGETIRLLTAGGVEIQNITYTDDPPWPTSAVDGGGYTLVIVDPLGNGSDPANWQVSGVLGGTPGTGEQLFLPGDFDQDGDVDGRDFLAWQRNPSVGSLSDWQEQYGGSELLVASGEWRESQELRVEGQEPDEEADPGSAIPGLEVVQIGDDIGGALGSRSPQRVFDLRGNDEETELYVEQVDRAVEQWSASTTLLNKSAVASFGEMVARRGVKRIVDCGFRIVE